MQKKLINHMDRHEDSAAAEQALVRLPYDFFKLPLIPWVLFRLLLEPNNDDPLCWNERIS